MIVTSGITLTLIFVWLSIGKLQNQYW